MRTEAGRGAALQSEPGALEAAIRGLYLGMLGREAVAPGLRHWLAVCRAGGGVDAVACGLAESQEYRLRQRDLPAPVDVDAIMSAAVRAALPLLADAPITIVDVGAQNLANEEHVYAPLARLQLPHTVIGFEPLAHRLAERMAAGATGPGKLKLLPAFIGDGGEHTFHVNAPDATSSLLPFNAEVISRLVDLDGLKTVSTEPARTTTLDAALQDEGAVDLLKLDIQGFELTALRHAVATLARTLVVHCEVSFVEIYRGQALFSEVESFMRGQGFALIDLRSQCRYPLAGTAYPQSRDWLGWADAVFLRTLDDDASWRERLGQSLLMLALYRKPSLAAWLARGLGGTVASGYAGALASEPR